MLAPTALLVTGVSLLCHQSRNPLPGGFLSCMFGQRGFTQVELVVVIMLVGILAIVAGPRFVGRDAFDARGYADGFLGALQYARQQAVAMRRTVCFTAQANGYALTRGQAPGDTCTVALASPDGSGDYAANTPGAVSITGHGATALPYTVTFSPLGRPNAAAGFRVSGDVDRCIAVEAQTGHIRYVTC